MKIVEVFCGCGGFGALASTLGHEVVLGIDNDSIALDSWHKNNPKGVKKCLTLPPESPIQWPEGDLHVHFSSPCQSFSGAKRHLTDSEKTLGDSLLRWSLDTAINFKSWSFENVVSTHSNAILEEYKSKHPTKLDFTTAQCVDFGVPQQRTRLIAAPPATIQRFKELAKTRSVTVEEALKAANLPVNSDSVRSMAKLRTSGAPCLRKVTQPAYTVLTRPLRWHFESKRGKALTVPQMAVLQSFPAGYKFPTSVQDGYRVIGNAVPPNLGLAILCAATGVEFTPTLPPAIKYAAVEPESSTGTPASALQAQLEHLRRELAEVKAMVSKLVS